MSSALQDLRYALRQLRRNPGFALVAILTLGLGIGANAAIFSVVDSILLEPLPFPQPHTLVALESEVPFPKGCVRSFQRHATSLSPVAGYSLNQEYNVTGSNAADRTTTLTLDTAVQDQAQLAAVLRSLARVPNVIGAMRVE